MLKSSQDAEKRHFKIEYLIKNFQTDQVEYKHFTNCNMNNNNDENQSTNSTPRTETCTKNKQLK